MGGADGSADFPVGFPVELVSFNEYRAGVLRGAQNNNICWDSLFRMDLDDIPDLNILRLDLFGTTILYNPIGS